MKDRFRSTGLLLRFAYHALVSIWFTDTRVSWDRKGKMVSFSVSHRIRET